MKNGGAYVSELGQTTSSSKPAPSGQVSAPIRKEVFPSNKGNLLDLDDFLSSEPLPKGQTLTPKSSPKHLSLTAQQAVSGSNKPIDLLDWF